MRAPEAPIGMSECNGAAVDIDFRLVPSHLFVDTHGLRGKRFVGLNQVKIRNFPVGIFECFSRCGDRTRPHNGRVNSGDSEGFNAGQGR